MIYYYETNGEYSLLILEEPTKYDK